MSSTLENNGRDRKNAIPSAEIIDPQVDPFYEHFSYEKDEGTPGNHLDDYKSLIESPLDKTFERKIGAISSFVLTENNDAMRVVKLLHFASNQALHAIQQDLPYSPEAQRAYSLVLRQTEAYLRTGITKHMSPVPLDVRANKDRFILQLSTLAKSALENVQHFRSNPVVHPPSHPLNEIYTQVFLSIALGGNRGNSISIYQPLKGTSHREVEPNAELQEAYNNPLNKILSIIEISQQDTPPGENLTDRIVAPGLLVSAFKQSKHQKATQDILFYPKGNIQLRHLVEPANKDVFMRNAYNIMSQVDRGNFLLQRLVQGILLPYTPFQINSELYPNILSKKSFYVKVSENAQSTDVAPLLKNIFAFHTDFTHKLMHPALDSDVSNINFDKQFDALLNHLDDINIRTLAYISAQNLLSGFNTLKAVYPEASVQQINRTYPVYHKLIGENEDYDGSNDMENVLRILDSYHRFLPTLENSLRKRIGKGKRLDTFIHQLKASDLSKVSQNALMEVMQINPTFLENSAEMITGKKHTEEETFLQQLDILKEYIEGTKASFVIDYLKNDQEYMAHWQKFEIAQRPYDNSITFNAVVGEGTEVMSVVADIRADGSIEIRTPSLLENDNPALYQLIHSVITSSVSEFLTKFKNEFLPQKAKEADDMFNNLFD